MAVTLCRSWLHVLPMVVLSTLPFEVVRDAPVPVLPRPIAHTTEDVNEARAKQLVHSAAAERKTIRSTNHSSVVSCTLKSQSARKLVFLYMLQSSRVQSSHKRQREHGLGTHARMERTMGPGQKNDTRSLRSLCENERTNLAPRTGFWRLTTRHRWCLSM